MTVDPARALGYREHPKTRTDVRTLTVDIGGTGIKAAVLDFQGAIVADRVRIDTPVGRPPSALIRAVGVLTRQLPPFDRVSVGFPGAVGAGRVLTAPTLGHRGWLGLDLAAALSRRFQKPTRVSNDVALQGLGVITRKGVELVITLGTGLGSALYLQGLLVPQFTIGHHAFRRGETYTDQLDAAALERVGPKKWNKRLADALRTLPALVRYDHLYIGGGNARQIVVPLDSRTTIISNEAGLSGGIELWRCPVGSERRPGRSRRAPAVRLG